jgi:signal transduction histidine kinase
MLWVQAGESRVLLAALPAFAERQWLRPAQAAAQTLQMTVTWHDPALRTDAPGEKPARATGLPWTLGVSHANADGELARFDERRRLWLAGFGALVLMVIAGAYFIARSMGRELAVARLQSDFVAAVSHEFRTPLTSMRQLTEILVDDRVTGDDRRRAYYGALARQTDRLHRLVESLLDLGRLEAGRSPYRLEPLDACALVRSVVEDFARETAGHGVQIDVDINGDAFEVAGDRDALTNALWNLLDNAVKYSPDRRCVWVTLHRQADRLLIRVRDEGIGIPTSEHRVIFDKFVRGSAVKASGFTGTGIGLSMVRHIVRAHSGDVRVESVPGVGSTFTLALPLAKSGAQGSKLEAIL